MALPKIFSSKKNFRHQNRVLKIQGYQMVNPGDGRENEKYYGAKHQDLVSRKYERILDDLLIVRLNLQDPTF
jgi:hypothetical protein